MYIRNLTGEDIPALETAIAADKYHPGEWTPEHFLQPTVHAQVAEDDNGPTMFVRFTKSLRISCVWASENRHRNLHAAIQVVKHAAAMARNSGFTELLVESDHEPLRKFLERVLKMQSRGRDMVLYL